MAERSNKRDLNMEMLAKEWYKDLQILEEKPFTEEERLQAANEPVLAWFSKHARILPWRENPEAYRVWISEIMLQQTRVEAVKPYYERFLKVCPTPKELAEIEDDRLMKLWEGLGYYNRARNLKKAAAIICEEYGGNLPNRYEELLILPGIGSYTAGAIASIAYGRVKPAVDGNVLRVISRVLLNREDILKASVKRSMEALLEKTMPKDHPGDYNQALMEIGAMVCLPNGKPRCEECPFASLCLAHREHVEHEIPVKKPKKARKQEERTVLVIENADSVSLRKRPATGLLAGLYELPNFEGKWKKEEIVSILDLNPEEVESIEKLPDAKHIFSHVEWRMMGYLVKIKGELPKQFLSINKQCLETEYSLPSAFGAYRKWV